jgi:futalosine hydrolase
MTRLLVVTAVEAEREAIHAGLRHRTDRVRVIIGGVGSASSAAYASRELALAGAAGDPYQMACSTGIGGAFTGRAAIGEVVIGRRSIAADLGADSPDGFIPVTRLGFGRDAFNADPGLVTQLATMLPAARLGEILTVSTVTGTAARTCELAVRHPDALVEAMEGVGVAAAAAVDGVAFVEVRTISNLIGPRDREAWRIGPALAALAEVGAALGTLVE